jgi:hypothetical protein
MVAADYCEIVVNLDRITDDEGLLFRGSGSMNYPEGEMRVTHDEVRLQPRKAMRTSLGWPAVVLPRKEVRGVERMLFGVERGVACGPARVRTGYVSPGMDGHVRLS